MGFFHDDDHSSGSGLPTMRDWANFMGMWFKLLKPLGNDIKNIRDRAALRNADAQMLTQVKTPGSVSENPALMDPVLAEADLSLPPLRNAPPPKPTR